MGLTANIALLFHLTGVVLACEIKACYYRNGAASRPQPYTVTPEMLNPQHCNVMIYAFAVIENNQLTPSITADEDTASTKGLYSRFVNLKSKNTNLTILLSVGGWDFGSEKFSSMSSTSATRKTFIDHAITFLRKYNFDGLDLHWEFPAYRGGTANDKFTFTLLVQELRASFELESKKTGRARLKLTAALAGDTIQYSQSYEVDKIAKELDFVSIMTYDYSVKNITMHPSLIYEDSPNDTMNIKYAVRHYLQKGVPKNKLVIGLPTYGRGYSIMSREKYHTSTDKGVGRSYATGLDSILGWFEICRYVESGFRVARRQGVPYISAYLILWLGFEDNESVRQKVMFAKRHGLAGIMVWSLDMDDVEKKFCKKPTQNLIETVHETCDSNVPTSSVDPPLPNEESKLIYPYTHPYPLWKKPPYLKELSKHELREICKDKKGIVNLPYPNYSCRWYIRCEHGFGSQKACIAYQSYDPEISHCIWQEFIPQCRMVL